MWNRKKYIEGIIAKSLYEPLTPRERKRLDRAIASDASLGEVAARLEALVDKLPADSDTNAPDLLSDLRIAIASAEPEPSRRRRISPVVQAVGLAIGLCGAFGIWMASNSWGPVDRSTVVEAPGLSLMQQAIREAEADVSERNPGKALHLLDTALRAQPADPDAAAARLMLADLSYDESLFGPALDAYAAVQANHGDFVANQDEAVRLRIAERIELLDECRVDDFEMLLAYNAALREGDGRFERLEQVAARAASNPHGLLAARVVWSMAETLGGPEALTGADARVAALERVRDRCANTIVAARASFEAGRAYETEVGDMQRAAEAYRVAGENSTYKEAAATALARVTR